MWRDVGLREQTGGGRRNETGNRNDDDRGNPCCPWSVAFGAGENRQNREQRPQSDQLNGGIGLSKPIAGRIAAAEAGNGRQVQAP
ncbi:MAG TPA: hypothetical protein VFP38_08225 [Bradyrhizobium sp.]|nr:hypothetical protein [Bradyrhizobium sp.]